MTCYALALVLCNFNPAENRHHPERHIKHQEPASTTRCQPKEPNFAHLRASTNLRQRSITIPTKFRFQHHPPRVTLAHPLISLLLAALPFIPNMLATSTAKRAFLARSVGSTAAARSLSVLSAPPGGSFPPPHQRQSQHRLQQQRTLLGFVHAIDKRVYQWAKRQMPPISKTEQIALGCGTIGAFLFLFCCVVVDGTDVMAS